MSPIFPLSQVQINLLIYFDLSAPHAQHRLYPLYDSFLYKCHQAIQYVQPFTSLVLLRNAYFIESRYNKKKARSLF